jgi:hypothetical protein
MAADDVVDVASMTDWGERVEERRTVACLIYT